MHEKNQVDQVSLVRSLNKVVRIDGPVTSGKAPMIPADEADGRPGADNVCTIKSPRPYASGAFARNDEPQRGNQPIAHRGATPSFLLRPAARRRAGIQHNATEQFSIDLRPVSEVA
ncbi:hypothetical protein [Bradyrhizobium sp. USDA 4454]